MSAESRASTAMLARLLVEIGEDRRGLERRMADAVEAQRRMRAQRTDPGALALAAVALHGWYTGVETIFERIARELDGDVPRGDRWHRELLAQMAAEIPGTRPPVLTAALVPDLAALLAFRHFFRHAYAVSLDPGHLETELARLVRTERAVSEALDGLVAFARAALARLAAEPEGNTR